MKAVKKYLAVMMSIFIIAGMCPAAVYASPEEVRTIMQTARLTY